jgi:NADH:ubiquinone oxidoreductase subunit B14.5a (Complex I-B14.5a)
MTARSVLRFRSNESRFSWRDMHDSSQPPPVVPQGPYKNVFDISYYSRDSRRRMTKEQVDPTIAVDDDLPPTPGRPLTVTYLGLAGDYDISN